MAENKKSFILYADLIHTVKKMPKSKQADLFMTILSYVNDENPVVNDLVVSLVFEPIKQQLKRDLKEWEVTKKAKSESGRLGNLKRWHKDLFDQVIEGKITIENAEVIAKGRTAINPIAKIAVNVNDNVTVNVNEKDNNTPPAKNFRIEECLTVAMNDPRWVKANNVKREDLQKFNEILEKRGVYEKNPADYKTHYANYKATGKFDNGPPGNQSESINDKILKSLKAHAEN